MLELDMDDLTKSEVAAARPLLSDDPVHVREVEAYLLACCENRRRFESWRRGFPLRLELNGFIRTPGKLEIRGKLREDLPTDGCGMPASDCTLRLWEGPGMPGQGKMLTADDLPVRI